MSFERLKLERLKRLINQSIQDYERSENHWTNELKVYDSLKDRLSTLNHRLKHDIMVPFGSVGFMPGKLVQTNEILVHLGCDFYVEKSCFQAVEIIDRKIEYVKQILEKIRAEILKAVEKLNFMNSVNEQVNDVASENLVEIKEPCDSNSNLDQSGKKKRVAHRPKEKNVKIAKEEEMEEKIEAMNAEVAKSSTDQGPPQEEGLRAPRGVSQREYEALLKRLDDLEKMEDEMDNSFESDDGVSMDTDGNEVANRDSDSGSKKKLSVTFCDDAQATEEPFPTASDSNAAAKDSFQSKTIVNEETGFSSLPKSILRNREEKSPVDSSQPTDHYRTAVVKQGLKEVFTGAIVEKSTTSEEGGISDEGKKVSKFKQARMKGT